MKGVLYKIKQNKLDAWKKWCTYLMTHEKEVLKTMKYEGVTLEGFLLFELNGKFYTLGFGDEGTSPADMTNELNQKHSKTKTECLEKVSRAESLYFFHI